MTCADTVIHNLIHISTGILTAILAPLAHTRQQGYAKGISKRKGHPMTYMDRYRYLNKLPKYQLAQMHVRNGGIMGLQTYLKWTKEELINILIEDEEADARHSVTYTDEGAGFGGQDITWDVPR